MTPEGYVKYKIDKVLKEYQRDVWCHKPVLNGMGKACLDYHGCCVGDYFAIEAKAPGGKLTARQEITKEEIEHAGGKVFVISDDEGITALRQWLYKRRRT